MKIALGTVQFGLAYGVANELGKVPVDEARSIIKFSSSSGISMVDTAISYGVSESVLGSIGIQGWDVVTKIPALPSGIKNIELWLFEQVQGSLERLGVEQLYGILLHNPSDILGVYGEEYICALKKIQKSGIVKFLGYSIYSPDILCELTHKFWPEIVQAPFNVFDQRLKNSGWLDRLFDGGVRVHVRSIFLQGLLISSNTMVPKYFAPWSILLHKWRNYSNEINATSLEIALNFVLKEYKIDRVLVGVDGLQQVKEIVAAYEKIQIPVLDHFACNDVNLIEPNRWKL